LTYPNARLQNAANTAGRAQSIVKVHFTAIKPPTSSSRRQANQSTSFRSSATAHGEPVAERMVLSDPAPERVSVGAVCRLM